MMPANEGDFFWISYGKEKINHILIDGGLEDSGHDYADIIEEIYQKDEKIEGLILTHIDSDHLQGAMKGITELSSEILQKTIKKVYFNTCRGIMREQRNADFIKMYAEDDITVNKDIPGYGVGDAISFLNLLSDKAIINVLDDYVVSGRKITLDDGALLKVISPNEKQLTSLLDKWEKYNPPKPNVGYSTNDDYICENLSVLMNEKFGRDGSVNNASSIAFIFEYEDVKIAFLADALSSTCLQGIKNLVGNKDFPVDVLKLSHHGSRSNISDRLIKKLPTLNYMLSTNGRGGEVPNKVVLAHLIDNKVLFRENPVRLLCNYKWWDNVYKGKYFTEKDRETYLDSGKLTIEEVDENGFMIKDGLWIYGEY